MPELNHQRISLPTGVDLDVFTAGNRENPAMIFLHGFPESHLTWRHQLPEFATDHFVIAPDQRGYARSSKPQGIKEYAPEKPVADLIALADHFNVPKFTLVAHDWGGAVAWMAALKHPERIAQLIIINAPHPFLFQQLLFDDMEQRAASQYIRSFREPSLDDYIAKIGLEQFFDTTFVRHADPALLAPEKANYIDEWSQPGAMTAMLNWYRASAVIVPPMDETPERPAFLDGPFPPVTMPTLVIWGMKDTALRPSLIRDLDPYVPDLSVVEVDAGHFVPWEAPDAVNSAIRNWLSRPSA